MDGKLVGTVSLKGLLGRRVYIDGAVNQMGSGMGLVLVSLEGITIKNSLRLNFSAMNNEVEYEALLVGSPWFKKWAERQWKCSWTLD